jgi:universal stress protein E
MKKLRRILVAVADLHHTHGGALRRAAELARSTGARVELFHVVTVPLMKSKRFGRTLVPFQLTLEESVAVAQKSLARIVHSELFQGCRVDSVAVAETPAHEAIVRRAMATHSDLIINGTSPRGFANRMLLRHTDWELVRHSPVPLLLVKSTRQARKPLVLAAIDPLHANSKPARLDGKILDVASGMATILKATVHAFHAYMPLSVVLAASSGEPVVWDIPALETKHTQVVLREFTRALRRTKIPASRRHLRAGAAATELPECARSIRATLVVMGAVSRSWLDRLFVGNTAERVLDELVCDVLIVKPPGLKDSSAARQPRGFES